MTASLISPDDHATLWALMAAGTALSIWLEQRFRWAARLSGPVLALLIAMALSNTHVVPMESRAYDFVTEWLVPLAIPLLLFRANFREIISTGRMFFTFHIAAVGTLLGTVLAVLALKPWIKSPDLAHAAGMMAASYIGGGVNFMAVKASYHVRETVSNPLIVADNFIMAGAFIMMLTIAASRWFRARFPHPHSMAGDSEKNLAAEHWQRKGISLLDLARTLAFAFAVVAAAALLGRVTLAWFGDVSKSSVFVQVLHVLCTNKFVLLTVVTLACATLFHRSLAKVNGAEELGTYMLLVFLFTLGLPADLLAVIIQAPLFLVFCAIIAGVNIAFTLLVGKLLRQNLEELLLATNATLGGAPSAAAMATSAGWPKLVLPGILVGIWGYVVGTPIGIVVVEMLLR
jgi:uncharacterized membrane protein